MAEPKILVVEDDTAIRTLVVAALKREPLVVHTAGDGVAALECMRANEYAVILLDLMMPRLNGYDFLDSLDTVCGDSSPIIIVMTAFEASALRKLPPNRVHAILHKPFDVERVVDLVRDCAFVHRQERERTMPHLPELHGSDEDAPVC
ncbi:MAG TPA: response regulator [Thermoanaerobaculia bacterium]|jgi:CheY-like chemotaxis protein